MGLKLFARNGADISASDTQIWRTTRNTQILVLTCTQSESAFARELFVNVEVVTVGHLGWEESTF